MSYWFLIIITYFQAHERSAGFSIYTYIPQNFYPLSDPKYLVYHHDPRYGCLAPVMNITVNNISQGIVFINTRPEGYTSGCPEDNVLFTGIEICEIRVMGLCCWFFFKNLILIVNSILSVLSHMRNSSLN